MMLCCNLFIERPSLVSYHDRHMIHRQIKFYHFVTKQNTIMTEMSTVSQLKTPTRLPALHSPVGHWQTPTRLPAVHSPVSQLKTPTRLPAVHSPVGHWQTPTHLPAVHSPVGHWQIPSTQTVQFFKTHSSNSTSQSTPVKPCGHMHI